jgi:hypothetical protein
MKRRTTFVLLITAFATSFLAACSTSGSVSDTSPVDTPAQVTVVPEGSDPKMGPLCDQIIADSVTPEDAAAMAEAQGFTSRVGTIDGEPQAVTMDYRLDRFTFTVDDGVVTDCVIG